MFASIPVSVECKVVFIGDSGAGKTVALSSTCGDRFTDSFISTTGVDLKLKNVSIANQPVIFKLWDTSGEERYEDITSSYYRTANAIVVCLDLTLSPEKQNERIIHWMREIDTYAPKNVSIFIMGMKADLIDSRVKAISKNVTNNNVTNNIETLEQLSSNTIDPRVKGVFICSAQTTDNAIYNRKLGKQKSSESPSSFQAVWTNIFDTAVAPLLLQHKKRIAAATCNAIETKMYLDLLHVKTISKECLQSCLKKYKGNRSGLGAVFAKCEVSPVMKALSDLCTPSSAQENINGLVILQQIEAKRDEANRYLATCYPKACATFNDSGKKAPNGTVHVIAEIYKEMMGIKANVAEIQATTIQSVAVENTDQFCNL